MADWDADDFEPDTPATVTVAKVTDKWDGEDEDDDVKVFSCHFYSLDSCSFVWLNLSRTASSSGECEGVFLLCISCLRFCCGKNYSSIISG